MKKILLFLPFFIFCFWVVTPGQTSKVKNDPVGRWILEAPFAPAGYTSGLVEVFFTDTKYSTTLSFTGNENKLQGDKVNFENDTLMFSVSIDGQIVSIILQFVENSKMSGKAVYSEGEVPLTLTLEKKE
jgi:hypothetical protein